MAHDLMRAVKNHQTISSDASGEGQAKPAEGLDTVGEISGRRSANNAAAPAITNPFGMAPAYEQINQTLGSFVGDIESARKALRSEVFRAQEQ